MDGISAIKRPPDMVDAWFGAMPLYLIKDILRIATDHEVIYQAAKTLLSRANTPKSRSIVYETMLRHTDHAIAHQLSMLLVESGDKTTTQLLVKALKGPIPSKRIQAAVQLAGGGDAMGINALKRNLSLKNEQGMEAASALGRYASLNSERLLSSALSHSSGLHLKIALGEMRFRRLLPEYYRIFLISHRFARRSYQESGLYETWMLAMYLASSDGASTPDQFRNALTKLTKTPPLNRDKEAVRRQLSAFIDFWDHAKTCLVHPAVPPWPEEFSTARQNLRMMTTRGEDPDQIIASRLSASIALIAATGKKIGYDMLASPSDGIRALSPSGERALDGNLTTSWQIRKKGRIVLEHPALRHIDAIWIMVGCHDQPPKRQKININVEATAPDNTRWKISRTIQVTNQFFNKLPINRKSSNRIDITLSSSDANARICIPEIRMPHQATPK